MPQVRADLTEAKEGGFSNPRNVEEGDYLFVIESSEITQIKSGDNKGKDQVELTLSSPEIAGATYKYWLPLSGAASWKFSATLRAAGFDTAGKKMVNFNTDKLHGKRVAGTLIDDEYKGNLRSKIDGALFSEAKLKVRRAGGGDAEEVVDLKSDDAEEVTESANPNIDLTEDI